MAKKIAKKKMRKKRRKLRKLKTTKRRSEDLLDTLKQNFSKLEVLDEDLRETIRALGDVAQAKRVHSLQEEWPRGTLPELVAMDWLNSRHHRYFYQVQILGGRRAGGLVPDFILPQGGGALALLVNGLYWHSGFEQSQRDSTARVRLLGTNAFGFRIDKVVETWDSRMFATWTTQWRLP